MVTGFSLCDWLRHVSQKKRWRVFPSLNGVDGVFPHCMGMTGFSLLHGYDGFFPHCMGMTGFSPGALVWRVSPIDEFHRVVHQIPKVQVSLNWYFCLSAAEIPVQPHLFNLVHVFGGNCILELGLDVKPKARCIHQALMLFDVDLSRFLPGGSRKQVIRYSRMKHLDTLKQFFEEHG